ncbi:MAG: nucleotidyltransferase family protein [Candidatus Omnitrophota bacterium]|nr:nucleotidyltransferase family protein [Candidatus Omnitrophota bacterium]
MRILILAAGYAVRLRPLTLNTSKSLLAIGGRKIIDRVIDKIVRVEDAGSISVIVNAKHFRSFLRWRKGSRYKDRISLINDGSVSNETRLGAVRDMELAIKKGGKSEDLLVIAGDNLFDFELDKFIKFAEDRPDGVTVALHDIGSLEEAGNFGVVKIDEASRVVEFKEKPPAPKSTLISTGVYYFPKEKLSFIGDYVKIQNNLDAPGNYISWLAKRDRVYGFVFLEDWCDIGTNESYKKADAAYQKKEREENDEE